MVNFKIILQKKCENVSVNSRKINTKILIHTWSTRTCKIKKSDFKLKLGSMEMEI